MDTKCISCGKSISEDTDNFDEWFCWKCDNIPTRGDDWKWELYHPYEYLQEEYDEES